MKLFIQIFSALFGLFIGGVALALGQKAIDSMSPTWIGLAIAFMAVVIGGALLLDRQSGGQNPDQ